MNPLLQTLTRIQELYRSNNAFERSVAETNLREELPAIIAALEAADGLYTAVSAIHSPLGDETADSGNPCSGPSPAQGRSIAAAIFKYEDATDKP